MSCLSRHGTYRRCNSSSDLDEKYYSPQPSVFVISYRSVVYRGFKHYRMARLEPQKLIMLLTSSCAVYTDSRTASETSRTGQQNSPAQSLRRGPQLGSEPHRCKES